ncbi:MAG TPA: murein biosynthesis integral membrane protein MurJ [Anaerolineae bacterium]|nr:murein biosynthesis integral membrane protein MurJ [Anaerolineae bacterium]
MKESSASTAPVETGAGSIARATGIIALGNVASRVLGLVREQIITYRFGATGLVSAFDIASTIPTMIYDMLIGGMLSAALVPVFSEVGERDGPMDLWAVFSRVLSLIAVVLAVVVLLLELLAPQVAWLLTGSFPELLGGAFRPELQDAVTRMIRIIAPATLIFGVSGIITALLYALKRFTFPAFGAAVFNLGIIIAVPLLANQLDAFSLAVGVLLGSVLQMLILTPDLRGLRVRFQLDLRHPALRRIVLLYLPVAAAVILSNIQIMIDRRLAAATGESSVAWMKRATTLVQLPHGMVAVAVSLAVLPTLSRLIAAGDPTGFRRTLGQGLRLVLVLIVPATVGLFLLAEPVIGLLFEHGEFTARDTFWTAWALRYYMLGLIFASVDFPLNYAFYARQDTVTPALVGVLSVAVYLGVALALLRPLGMLGLVLADSAKHFSHATTMLYLTQRRIGPLADLGLGGTTGRVAVATVVMGVVVVGALAGVERVAGVPGLVADTLAVAVPAGLGAAAYLGVALVLGVGEVGMVRDMVRKRLGK